MKENQVVNHNKIKNLRRLHKLKKIDKAYIINHKKIIFFIFMALLLIIMIIGAVYMMHLDNNKAKAQKKLPIINFGTCDHLNDVICPDGFKATRVPVSCNYKCSDIQEIKYQRERSLSDIGISASIPSSFNIQECSVSGCSYYKDYAPGRSSSRISITKDVNKDYQPYVEDPRSVDNLKGLEIGESKVLDTPNTKIGDSFTYTRLNDIRINGYTANVYENNNPWEGDKGTAVRVIFLEKEKEVYEINAYVYVGDSSNDVNGITLKEFNDLLSSIRFTKPSSTGIHVTVLRETSYNCPDEKENCLLLSDDYNQIIVKTKDGEIIGSTPSLRKNVFIIDLAPGEYVVYAANKTQTQVFLTNVKDVDVNNGNLTNIELLFKKN